MTLVPRNVHGEPAKLVKLPPLLVKVTVPVGAVGVAEVSVTVAVQLVTWPETMVDGEQVTVVLVPCRLRDAVPELGV